MNYFLTFPITILSACSSYLAVNHRKHLSIKCNTCQSNENGSAIYTGSVWECEFNTAESDCSNMVQQMCPDLEDRTSKSTVIIIMIITSVSETDDNEILEYLRFHFLLRLVHKNIVTITTFFFILSSN